MIHSHPNFARKHRKIRRRGTAYLLVVGMMTLLTVAALAAAMTARISVRSVGQATDARRAEALAESAVSWAIAKLAADASWRTTYTNNVATAPVTSGAGTISFKLVDETDANLSNNAAQAVRLYGIGRCGSAVKVLSVRLTGRDPLTCVSTALCVNGNITASSASFTAPFRTVATNANFTGNSSTVVNANLAATANITLAGSTVNGTQTPGATARTMPDASVFDYYLANGTEIPYSWLSSGTIDRKVISPSSSGYLFIPRNDKGIYYIDCGGQPITIKRSRIIGTLVILNPGSGSVVGGIGADDVVNWVPAIPNFPCLLVSGDMSITFSTTSSTTLSESNISTNFNPSGAPYPYSTGTTDSDTSDTYPAIIDGLVYVSGNMSRSSSGSARYPKIGQLIVGGNYTVADDKTTFSYHTLYNAAPPPGFTGGGALQTVPASWRWELAN